MTNIVYKTPCNCCALPPPKRKRTFNHSQSTTNNKHEGLSPMHMALLLKHMFYDHPPERDNMQVSVDVFGRKVYFMAGPFAMQVKNPNRRWPKAVDRVLMQIPWVCEERKKDHLITPSNSGDDIILYLVMGKIRSTPSDLKDIVKIQRASRRVLAFRPLELLYILMINWDNSPLSPSPLMKSHMESKLPWAYDWIHSIPGVIQKTLSEVKAAYDAPDETQSRRLSVAFFDAVVQEMESSFSSEPPQPGLESMILYESHNAAGRKIRTSRRLELHAWLVSLGLDSWRPLVHHRELMKNGSFHRFVRLPWMHMFMSKDVREFLSTVSRKDL